MASGRAALAMLTRLPVRSATGDSFGSRWFGLVGAIVGAAGLVPLVMFGAALPAGAAILALGAMAILSGALHLDGLADTADALVAMGAGAAERARKDPSIGVGGASALVLVLGLEVVSLAAMVSRSGAVVAGFACLAGGAASRAVPVVVAVTAHSRASGTGLGAAFVRQVSPADALVATLTAVVVALIAAMRGGGPTLLVGCLVGVAGGVGLGLLIVRLRGKLDGDGLGATVELSFAATLLTAATISPWPAA